MSIYRCNSCGFIAEVAPVEGVSSHCGRCAKPVTVYGTVFFIERILQRYTESLREVKKLKETLANFDQQNDSGSEPESTAMKDNSPEAAALDHTFLPTEEQHFPLHLWFKGRQFDVRFQYENVDLSGYFDEAANQIVEHEHLLADVIGKVGWSYRKNHSGINIDLNKMAQKDVSVITKICRSWYDGALFSKYFYQKNEKVLRLGLQTATPARQFFTGGWLEWFALSTVLKLQDAFQKRPISVARGAKVQFPNEDLFELDVVALFEKQLFVIECTSGEFRSEINRLSRLQKRLGLDARYFVICSPQLDEAQAKGMTAMYGISFVNLQMLAPHIQRTLAAG